MEQGSRQCRISVSCCQCIPEMLWFSCTAGCDDRNTDRVCNGAGHIKRKAVADTIGIHTGQQNLTGTALYTLHRPFHGIKSGRDTSSVQIDLPSSIGTGFNIHRQHDTLAAKAKGGFGDEFRMTNSRAVE